MRSNKIFSFILSCLVATAALSSCSEDAEVSVESDITLSETSVTLSSSEGAAVVVRFTSATEWTAEVSDSWLTINKESGSAGSCSVLVTAASENDEKEARSTTLTIAAPGLIKTVTVTQKASNYVSPDQTEYELAAEGDTALISVTTNVSAQNLRAVFSSESSTAWASISIDNDLSTDDVRVYKVIASENISSARSGVLQFYVSKGLTVDMAAEVTISQEATNLPTSTDYSQDKKVVTIQRATKGSGVPVVIMGDAFLDTDIEDGTYDEVMRKAAENLFTEQPMTALKDYFDLYYVCAVSHHDRVGSAYKTAFSCVLAGNGSTSISGDEDAVREYLSQVEGVDADKALAIVIINTSDYAGTTYFGYQDDNEKFIDFAIAYCPVIDDLDSERFRAVLNHEAIGHGFAKLEDEYSYERNGTITNDDKALIELFQASGWAQNVDFSSDVTETLWADLAADDNFSSESLGAYEGAATFYRGIYRPTSNSMMRHNSDGFNAPSRRAIYNRVMTDATGSTPSNDEFVAFDVANNTSSSANKSIAASLSTPFGRPVFRGKAK